MEPKFLTSYPVLNNSLAVLCTHCTAELLLHFIRRSSAVHSVQKLIHALCSVLQHVNILFQFSQNVENIGCVLTAFLLRSYCVLTAFLLPSCKPKHLHYCMHLWFLGEHSMFFQFLAFRVWSFFIQFQQCKNGSTFLKHTSISMIILSSSFPYY